MGIRVSGRSPAYPSYSLSEILSVFAEIYKRDTDWLSDEEVEGGP